MHCCIHFGHKNILQGKWKLEMQCSIDTTGCVVVETKYFFISFWQWVEAIVNTGEMMPFSWEVSCACVLTLLALMK